MKLRIKILLYIIFSTALIFITSVGYINYRYWQYTKNMAIQISDLYAKQNATTAQSILNSDLKIVQTLENVFLGYSKLDSDLRNSIYQQILADVLTNNSNLLAVWMSWEISAIDAKWNLPYGRERTVCFWSMGNPTFNIDSANLEGDVPGTPYFLLKSGVEKNVLTDPYFYSYTSDTGSTFLETSIAQSIKIGDRFVGMVGIDVSLQRFQKLLQELKPFENSHILIVSNNGTIVAFHNESLQGKKIDKMFPEYNKYNVIQKIKDGDQFNFFIEKEDGTTDYVSFYPVKIEDSTLPWSLGFIVSTSVITQNIKENSVILMIFSIISLFIISIIIWTVLSIIVRPIEKTTKSLENLSMGSATSDLKINYNSKDELGRMAKAVNILIDSLLRTNKFAQEIGQGNLNAKYELSGKKDILGQSLIEMRDNLIKAQSEEQHRREQSDTMAWMQNGITEINEILREKTENIDVLASELIKFIVKYTKSVQGGFYLIEEKDGEKYIDLKAAYAFDRKKELKSKLELGEGLVGRVIKEKAHVNLHNLPEGYLYVRSGLGDKSPHNLIIIPLIFEDTVLGAFELAGFNQYTDNDLDFLNQIAVRITSSVSVLLKNVETTNLLKESQLQTATFEMKERQFMKQKTKLNEKQKEIDIKSSILSTAINAIKTIGMYLELDLEKTILDTNDYILKEFEVPREQIIGKKITDITIIPQTATLWYAKFWNDIIKGDIRKKKTVYNIENKEIEFTETFFKITDANNVHKIVIFGVK